MSYEVISDETVSVPRDKEVVTDQFGTEVSVLIEEVLYSKGDVIEDDNVSRYVKDKIEEGDDRWKTLLKKVSKDAGPAPLTEPLDGYDDLEEAEVLEKLKTLKSDEVSAVKAYERDNLNREEILDFNIGAKESPNERVNTVMEVPEEAKKTTKRGRPTKVVDPKEEADTKVVDADTSK